LNKTTTFTGNSQTIHRQFTEIEGKQKLLFMTPMGDLPGSTRSLFN